MAAFLHRMSTAMYKYTLFFGSAGVGSLMCRAFSGTPALPSRSTPGPSATLTSKLGVSFTPGGLLFPFHLGVAKSLAKEGFLATDSPLAGASAGALAAAVVGCGLDIDQAGELAEAVFNECRERGAAFNLKEIVARGLDNALPVDAHDILNNRTGRVTIGVTELLPRPKGTFVTKFTSRADLIEVLLGSCHVPFWFSGRPYMYVRGKPTVDGFFATPVKEFGAPGIASADQVLRVTVFPTTTVEVQADQPGGVISPDLLDRYASGRFLELLNYALNPGNEVVTAELFEAGFESGSVWCQRYGEAYRRRHEDRHGPSDVPEPSPIPC